MQIIIFTLSDKYYAIRTDKVEEISKKITSTMVPNSPDWVEGLINLRGNVVTLVNLCKLLHQSDDGCYNNIIIIHNEEDKVGLMVKDVNEVIDIDEKEIQKVSGEVFDGILGIVHMEEGIVNIIDIDVLLS
ncbi:chemotaxis protein CheW [Alkalibaculum sp. M08DMB]|uniref:Chemotaxis protein CheW n=1 Tax=Alkalibaculum sporogenes TaxID=2655001 RepID=A0A6A7K5V6_9FIRM|nr:chemotaxis protein CheW [Alkalibaculum sporogenes]MPW24762.1 chemotaxis protein CheW [Alkalibaculum sporogenes]